MFWMRRPPYLRWAAAALLVIGSAWVELRAPATVPRAFAARRLAPGQALSAGDVEWRRVPRGLLPETELLQGARAALSIEPGDPILDSMLTVAGPIPADWWSVPVTLPEGIRPGSIVRLVITDGDTETEGVVTAPPSADQFAAEPLGLVAVPGESAAVVAAAQARRALVVLVKEG